MLCSGLWRFSDHQAQLLRRLFYPRSGALFFFLGILLNLSAGANLGTRTPESRSSFVVCLQSEKTGIMVRLMRVEVGRLDSF